MVWRYDADGLGGGARFRFIYVGVGREGDEVVLLLIGDVFLGFILFFR